MVCENELVSGKYQLVLQSDGNMVLSYDNGLRWSPNVYIDGATNFPHQLEMHNDGNLYVITKSDSSTVWYSELSDKPAQSYTLEVQQQGTEDSCRFVINATGSSSTIIFQKPDASE